ncbi:MAG TPA: hypothetical protein VJ924_16860 [Alphaproteobacteria bacterium]|nr:hypothetical protein [Alphaproteobacteria bacterium]
MRAEAQHAGFVAGESAARRTKDRASAKSPMRLGAAIIDDARKAPFTSQKSAKIWDRVFRRHSVDRIRSPSSPVQNAGAPRRCRALIAPAKLIG